MARHGTCELLKRHTSSKHFLKIHVDVQIDNMARISYTIGPHCLTYSIDNNRIFLDWEYANICIRVAKYELDTPIRGMIFRINPTSNMYYFSVDSDNVWHAMMLNYKQALTNWNR
jgi:hypothetical protein